jgi:hypothetical protein
VYEGLRGKIDAEFEAQSALRQSTARLESDLAAARSQRQHLSALIPLAQVI